MKRKSRWSETYGPTIVALIKPVTGIILTALAVSVVLWAIVGR